MLDEDGRNYICMLQDIINRMAGNSANCKTWYFTILAALLAIQMNSGNMEAYIIVAIVMSVIFWWLDTSYLKLEKQYRDLERIFLEDPAKGKLYDFNPTHAKNDKFENYFCKSCKSWSVAIYYILVIAFVILLVVNPSWLAGTC